MARREWNVVRNGQFGRQAKSAGFRRNPQQHAGTGANRQKNPQLITVGDSVLVAGREYEVSFGRMWIDAERCRFLITVAGDWARLIRLN